MNRSHYTFGDNSLAARRLNLLASTFDESSRQLLAQLNLPKIDTALDVGCGPGHTTRLLADVAQPALTVGFDQSPNFVELAQGNYGSDRALRFQCCSVFDAPLPLPTAELVYSRFLLTHLAEPGRALRNLVERLQPGGHLVLEEVERLAGNTPLLHRYYELVTALQASHGQSTTIGSQLDLEIANQNIPVTTLASARNTVVLTGTQMPELHFMNIATWKQDPKMAAITTADELNAVEHGLAQLVASGSAHVECTLRQIVLVKR